MYQHTGYLLSIVLVLQACSNSAIREDSLPNVTSSPTAAVVYANGLKIGVTPLRANLYKNFPASWNDWVYQAAGVLMVKKSGCEDFVLKVNDYILSEPIHARLECPLVEKSVQTKPARIKARTKSETKQKAVKKQPVVQPENSIEKRLRRLERLYKKGRITTEEYNMTRKRILDEL